MPDPSTLALAALGGASLLLFRKPKNKVFTMPCPKISQSEIVSLRESVDAAVAAINAAKCQFAFLADLDEKIPHRAAMHKEWEAKMKYALNNLT